MRLHCLQHVPFEGPARIAEWARKRGHRVSSSLLPNNEALPQMCDFDWLVIMGGPMSVYDEKDYPWLVEEKRFIEKAIAGEKAVLGICLGAQLIANVLGAPVYRNAHKEIGWYPVSLTAEAENSPVFSNLPERFTAFHWHGDTFDLPSGCTRMAQSEACRNQAFEYSRSVRQGRVIGLQFHMESSIEGIHQLIANCSDDLIEGRYIQSPDEMLSKSHRVEEVNRIMDLLLDNIASSWNRSGRSPRRLYSLHPPKVKE